jgi:hypothetical protein
MDVELAIYQLRSLSYDGDVYVILITGVWNISYKGSQQFDETQWDNKAAYVEGFHRKQHMAFVAEPPELFRFKCADHRYTGDRNSTHVKRNNSLVCRVTARFNHGCARRQVQPYNSSQILHHKIIKHYYTGVLFHPS